MARLIVLAFFAYFLSFIFEIILIKPILLTLGIYPSISSSSIGIPLSGSSLYRIFYTAITWVIISYAHMPLGFIVPRVARFSDTKALRYVQHAIFVFLCFYIPTVTIIFIINIVDPYQKFLAHIPVFIVIIAFLIIALIITSFTYAKITELFPTKYFAAFIRFIDQSRMGYGGAGRFTGLPEELGAKYNPDSNMIFLGRSLFNPFLKCGLEDERHMLTIAGSRGGKGVSAIIPNLLEWKGSVIVIDPKGTNAAVTANFRSGLMKQDVHVFDPFKITSLEGTSFNPLQQVNPKSPDAREKINLIADALVMSEGQNRDPHWDDVSRQILAGFIAHILTGYGYENRQFLPELRNMLRLSGDDRSQLLADMSVNDSCGFLASDTANRIINMGDSPEFKSILSSIEKHTEWLSSPAIADCLSSETKFSFAKIKDSPSSVYFVIPPQYLKTHARFIRLFINLTISAFVDGGKAKVPTMFMMDEFLSLGHMKEVENAMSWTAGYNLFLWPFVQEFGSFKEIYGSKVNAFITNSRAIQVFAVDDEETNKFVSERLGKRPLTNRIEISRSNETLQVREPSEIALDISAESGRQYIIRMGKPTMLLERTPYYKSKMFGGYDPDPDHSEMVHHSKKMV